MADKTAFEIPESMRAFADKSVDQAKKAFDDYMNATVKAVAKAEHSAKSIQQGAQDANRKALTFLEENVAASFEFAQKMVRAKTLEEIGQIHQEFLRKQVETVQTQAKSLTEFIETKASEIKSKTTG